VTGEVLAIAGVVLTAGGSGVLLWLVLRDPDSAPRSALDDYLAFLTRNLGFTRSKRTAVDFATIQGAVIGVAVVGAVVSSRLFAYAAILVAVLPPLLLVRRARRRRTRIEEQLDGWLLMLANMLRATGSLTDAMRSTIGLTAKPISEEVDLVVKEVQLGEPLDRALENMSNRVDSALVSAALMGLRVGRTTGGNLPELLEQSAAAVREIARLEGVVRSQTAQGKTQLVVMALFPPFFFLGLRLLDPRFFDPLTGLRGTIVYSIAVGLWLGGVLLARKILAVDV
jgi:tight adherence protein B